MATTVTVETDKPIPPRGTRHLHEMETSIAQSVREALNLSTNVKVQVNIIKRT